MLPEKEYIEIKEKFQRIFNYQDFVELINDVGDRIYNRFTYLDVSFILSLANHNRPKRYFGYSLIKKNGGKRIINAPYPELKSILSILKEILYAHYTPHDCATGYIPGRSIVDNALMHVNKEVVITLDIKDFFHSFRYERIKNCFMTEPFLLVNQQEKIADLLTSLVTHPIKMDKEEFALKRLPQGSPSSPMLSNILCHKLDEDLSKLALQYSATYSRYADDLTLSADRNVLKCNEFRTQLIKIIEVHHQLSINKQKVRIQRKPYKQSVTGLIVNEKVNVPKKYVKRLRMYLFYWEKYGYNKASIIYLRDYSKLHQNKSFENINLINAISGKLQYLKMIKGEPDQTYNKLNRRFEKLKKSRQNKIDEIYELKSFIRNRYGLSDAKNSNLIKPYFVFFDTETNGLPKSFDAPIEDTENWPRLVQLAYMVCDTNGGVLMKENLIIKPDGFVIPKEASDLHGITNEIAFRQGKEVEAVLGGNFLNALKEASLVIGHNLSFDSSIIGAEFFRMGQENWISKKKTVCTMKLSTDFCAIQASQGYKWPKLSELYFKLFNEELEGAHNALFDVEATARCFWELKKRGVINIDSIHSQS